MYRKVEDFLAEWKNASAGTLNAMKAIPTEKMDVAIVEGHNSLGWLAWHLVSVGAAFGQFAGLQIPGPGADMKQPETMEEIVTFYEQVQQAFLNEATALTDEQLVEMVAVFGSEMPRGQLLRKLIDHQTHHRGQMTVLIRQAGLPVPAIMGPTKEMM